jgi:hypothetical protein
VTFFANTYPQYGIPELVELRVTEVVAVDETVRVKKSQRRKALEEAKSAAYQAEWELKRAREQAAEAQATIERLARLPQEVEARRQARKTRVV